MAEAREFTALVMQAIPTKGDPEPAPPPFVVPVSDFRYRTDRYGRTIIDFYFTDTRIWHAVASFWLRWLMVHCTLSHCGQTFHYEARRGYPGREEEGEPRQKRPFSYRIIKTRRRPSSEQRQDCYNEL